MTLASRAVATQLVVTAVLWGINERRLTVGDPAAPCSNADATGTETELLVGAVVTPSGTGVCTRPLVDATPTGTSRLRAATLTDTLLEDQDFLGDWLETGILERLGGGDELSGGVPTGLQLLLPPRPPLPPATPRPPPAQADTDPTWPEAPLGKEARPAPRSGQTSLPRPRHAARREGEPA